MPSLTSLVIRCSCAIRVCTIPRNITITTSILEMADQTAGSSADGGHQAKSPIEKHTEEPAPSADAQTVSAKVS
jgi:hypothetical protein